MEVKAQSHSEVSNVVVESDFVALARRRGAFLFRVVADHPKGGRGRVAHYINEDREAARRMAFDLAFCYRASNAGVEEIDPRTGEVLPVEAVAIGGAIA